MRDHGLSTNDLAGQMEISPRKLKNARECGVDMGTAKQRHVHVCGGHGERASNSRCTSPCRAAASCEDILRTQLQTLLIHTDATGHLLGKASWQCGTLRHNRNVEREQDIFMRACDETNHTQRKSAHIAGASARPRTRSPARRATRACSVKAASPFRQGVFSHAAS